VEIWFPVFHISAGPHRSNGKALAFPPMMTRCGGISPSLLKPALEFHKLASPQRQWPRFNKTTRPLLRGLIKRLKQGKRKKIWFPVFRLSFAPIHYPGFIGNWSI
jgi:hypothetical protein